MEQIKNGGFEEPWFDPTLEPHWNINEPDWVGITDDDSRSGHRCLRIMQRGSVEQHFFWGPIYALGNLIFYVKGTAVLEVMVYYDYERHPTHVMSWREKWEEWERLSARVDRTRMIKGIRIELDGGHLFIDNVSLDGHLAFYRFFMPPWASLSRGFTPEDPWRYPLFREDYQVPSPSFSMMQTFEDRLIAIENRLSKMLGESAKFHLPDQPKTKKKSVLKKKEPKRSQSSE